MGVGSIAVAAWIARGVLAILLVDALVQERFRVALVAGVIVVLGWLILLRVNGDLVTPFIAIVDIALVFVVLGRDVRLN
jgi:hypothetical protein